MYLATFILVFANLVAACWSLFIVITRGKEIQRLRRLVKRMETSLQIGCYDRSEIDRWISEAKLIYKIKK